MRGYRAAWLPSDAVAGLMLAAIAVPEQLATARLAGFPPAAGLVAFLAGSLAYAAFGKNPYLSVGADSTIAPIFAASIAAIVGANGTQYASIAAVVAVAVGLILISASIARAGWIANLLSVPVVVGVLAGISVHIVIGQLPAFFGVASTSGSQLERLGQLVREAGSSNGFDIAIGASVFGITLLSSRVNERVPGALIALVGASLATKLGSLQLHGVEVLGAISASVPRVHLPALPTFDQAVAIVPPVLIVAAVCIMQTSAVARSFPISEDAEPATGSDYLAVGIGNAFAGLLGAFPVNASPPRTALVKQSGGASQGAALVAVAAVFATVLAASQLLAYVPESALAGILIYVATRIVRVRDIARIAKYSPRELHLFIIAVVLVVIVPIQTGMLLAIMLSLAHGVQMMMWPRSTELVNVPGTTIWWALRAEQNGVRVPGVLVFAPAAPVNFTNVAYIEDRLAALLAQSASHVRLLVIDASSVTDIDYTGSQAIQATIDRLRAQGTDVAVARLVVTHAQTAASRSGLLDKLGADHLFMSVDEAVRHFARP
jgi:sulfate permease, SulP family